MHPKKYWLRPFQLIVASLIALGGFHPVITTQVIGRRAVMDSCLSSVANRRKNPFGSRWNVVKLRSEWSICCWFLRFKRDTRRAQSFFICKCWYKIFLKPSVYIFTMSVISHTFTCPVIHNNMVDFFVCFLELMRQFVVQNVKHHWCL